MKEKAKKELSTLTEVVFKMSIFFMHDNLIDWDSLLIASLNHSVVFT